MLFSALALSSFLAVASALPLSRLQTRQSSSSSGTGLEIVENCKVPGSFALTFDDGPYLYETQIAKLLKDAGDVKATFFLNGNNYQCGYDFADDLLALFQANHTLANHGWAHKDFATLNAQEINDELEKVEVMFTKILGVIPRFFRPPFGSTSPLLLEILEDRGYSKLFMWSEDSGDGDEAAQAPQQAMYDQACEAYPAPHMVLQHSPNEQTATKIVPYALTSLEGSKYKAMSVEACMGWKHETAYRVVGKPQERDETWVCS